MRQRFIWVDGKGLVEVPTSYVPRPRVHIIGDRHEPFVSMADGKTYDSKSAYRRELKARGYEEVACSRESLMQDAVASSQRGTPPLTAGEINHVADSIGYDWSNPA